MIKIVEAAIKGDYKVGIGLLGDTPVLVANTPKGEGYIPHPTLEAAGRAYDDIVDRMGMAIIKEGKPIQDIVPVFDKGI